MTTGRRLKITRKEFDALARAVRQQGDEIRRLRAAVFGLTAREKIREDEEREQEENIHACL